MTASKSPPDDRTLEEQRELRLRADAVVPALWVLFSSVPGLERSIIRLPSGPLVLGRSFPIGDRKLRDRRVSSQHLEVRLAGSRSLELRDLESHNGTYLDGAAISSATATPSSIIRIGGTLLQFVPDVLPLLSPEPQDPVWQRFGGVSLETRALRQRLRELAPLRQAVLFQGEPGVGKEQAARALHEQRRRPGELVALSCSVLTDELAASELFGHLRGAFPGAREDGEGAIRRAHRGTLFLDEVGELPVSVQPKLLRVLQDGRVRPVGSDGDLEVEVLVVSATHRDLASRVRGGGFRADLFSRLSAGVVTISPLRHRPADIVTLAQHFLGEGRRLHPRAMERLLLHPWPHNVRDLRAVVELLATQEGDTLRITAPAEDRLRADRATVFPASKLAPKTVSTTAVPWPASGRERATVLGELLRRCQGNVAEVARLVGKRPTSLRRWFDKYGIDPDQFR